MTHRSTSILALTALCLTLGPAWAEGNGKGNGHSRGHGPADGGPRHVQSCPPGLAKKNPACVPPGLAKQSYNVGERLTGDYILLANPQDYGMPDGTYYANDGYLYRVDPDTLEVLAIMGLVDQLLR